jgi:hypothetical protein
MEWSKAAHLKVVRKERETDREMERGRRYKEGERKKESGNKIYLSKE